MRSIKSSPSLKALRGFCCLALAISAGASAQPATTWQDQSATGFERMLAYSPYAGPTALSAEPEFDPLLLSIAKVRRRGHWAEATRPSDDAVAESFQRMLSSPPTTTKVAKPSRLRTGPRP